MSEEKWKWADISDDGLYRYALGRRLRRTGGYCLWIMLNPSTADHRDDDPTIRRIVDFTNKFGHSCAIVCNLFAYRTAYPTELKLADDPIGPENNDHILEYAFGSERIICAWGSHGQWLSRGKEVKQILWSHDYLLWTLGFTKGGEPKHPLYLSKGTELIEWSVMEGGEDEQVK